jgi:hypothetical protein
VSTGAWSRNGKRVDSDNGSAAAGPEQTGGAVGASQVRSVGLGTDSGYRSVVPGAGQVIEGLCGEVRSDDSVGSCSGVLVDYTQRPFHAWSTRKQPVFYHTVSLSLHTLLTRESRVSLGRQDRLFLGVNLASSVIQLRNTERLSEDWGTRGILFLLSARGRWCSHRQTVGEEVPIHADSSHRTKPRLRRRNRSLFSLGVALLELWYATPMEVLREKAAQEFDKPDISVSEAAEQFIGWLYRDAGRRYADAVRRCVLCLDYRDTDFRSHEFKEEFRQRILLPLEESMMLFYNV